jgi:hypothetical protein
LTAYCTVADIKSLIHTEKSDEEITQIITDASLDLDDRLNGAYMNDSIKRLCSMRLAAIVIAQSQRGVYSDKPANDSTTEWQNYVDEKVEAAKTIRPRHAKVVTYSQLHETE